MCLYYSSTPCLTTKQTQLINHNFLALQLDSDLTVAKYNRGTILYRMGKFEQALDDLKYVAESDQNNHEYKEALENCLKEIK